MIEETNDEYTLPSGLVVTIAGGVPEGVGKQELKDVLIRNGMATVEDFKTPETPETPEELNWLQKNMELPVGLAGAATGAALGIPFGPVGIAAGAIIGGAFGSGGGSLISNELAGEELDYAEAVEEALISAGFDIVTMGLGRIFKPAYFAAKAKLGFTPQEVAEEAVKIAEKIAASAPKAGSKESLQASQKILQEATEPASLTISQTGEATGLQIFKEKIGELGILSSAGASQNAQRVNAATADALQEVLDSSSSSVGATSEEMGQALLSVLTAGKSAASDVYGKGLDEIRKSLSGEAVSTNIIRTKLNRFLKAGNRKTFSMYSAPTLKYIDDLLKGPLATERLTARTLLDLDKKITQDIKAFGDINSDVYSDAAARELGSMVSVLKSSFINTLKTVDKNVAKDYQLLKTSYSEGMKTLLPKINRSFVENATDEKFRMLGSLVTKGTSTDNVRALLKSIDESFAQTKKAGGESAGVFKTAEDAKLAIKSGYLRTLLPTIQDENFDIAKGAYSRLADEFNKPDKNEMLKLVTGADYGRVKQLFNLMSEASKRPDGNIGSLVLRGKEFQTLSTLGQGFGGGAVATTGIAGLVSSAAILLGPVFLERASRNPKAVSKLLAFEKTNFKNDTAKEKAVALIIAEVMDGLTTEEQAELRNEYR